MFLSPMKYGYERDDPALENIDIGLGGARQALTCRESALNRSP